MKNIFKAILAAALIAFLLIYPQEVIKASYESLSTCVNVLFPALFPFFVLSKIFIKSGGVILLGKAFKFIMRPLFKINGNGVSSFILGILCGYPIGAKTAADLYNQNYINNKEAENLICFCNNSGPLFIIGAVGIGMLSSKSAGIFLYIVHILSAVTIGFILRFTISDKTDMKQINHIKKSENNIFTSSVEESIMSIINIFAYVAFFGIIMAVLNSSKILLKFENFLTLFGMDAASADSFIFSVFEMTTGIKKLSASSSALSLKLILISFMLGWSGMSIHFQTKSVLNNIDFPIKKYMLAKLSQGLIASVYAWAGSKFIGFNQSVFITTSPKQYDIINIPLHHLILTLVIGVGYIILQHHSEYNNRY